MFCHIVKAGDEDFSIHFQALHFYGNTPEYDEFCYKRDDCPSLAYKCIKEQNESLDYNSIRGWCKFDPEIELCNDDDDCRGMLEECHQYKDKGGVCAGIFDDPFAGWDGVFGDIDSIVPNCQYDD